jgi:tetratricopeptide (TPR) repeat protein
MMIKTSFVFTERAMGLLPVLLLGLAAASVPTAAAVPTGAIEEELVIEEDITFESAGSVRQLLEGARAVLKQGEFETAASRAAEAAARAEQLEDRRRGPLLAQALELEARALLALGKQHEARQQVARLVGLDPALQPPVRSRDAYSKLLRETRQTLVARLSVSSEPQGAEVILDGRLLGTTPLDQAWVLAGRHVLAVERLGFTRIVEQISLVAGTHLDRAYEMERAGSTLLLLTPTPGVRVSLDGVERGSTERPSAALAERLARNGEWPVDPHTPPPLLMLSPVPPGPHLLAFSAACHRERQMSYEIPPASDLVEVVSLERLEGSLRVELAPPAGGPLPSGAGASLQSGARVAVDGVEHGPPPVLVEGLCPGPHTIRVQTDPGLDLRRTVSVEEGATTTAVMEQRPTLAFLGAAAGTPEVLISRWTETLETLSRFNVTLNPELAPSINALENPARRRPAGERVVFASGAHLLSWLAVEPDGSTVVRLLAAGSAVPESFPVQSDGADLQSLRHSLERLPQRYVASLGLLAAPDSRGGLLVTALRPDGPAQRAGLRVGTRLLVVAGERAGDRPLPLLEQDLRPGEPVRLVLEDRGLSSSEELTPDAAAVGWSAARLGVPANALLAQLDADLAAGTTPDLPGDQLRRAMLQLELGDADAALAAARAARLQTLWGFSKGTSLYCLGRAALAADRPDEARAALSEALSLPHARPLGPYGPPLLPAVKKLFEKALAGAD